MMIISSNMQTNISVAQPSVSSKDAELLKLLVLIYHSCLEHHHSYSCKDAVFAVYAVYREFENIIPDAPEIWWTFLAAESDTTCKRNAFVFLAHCNAKGSRVGY
jgi:coatomer subunit beta